MSTIAKSVGEVATLDQDALRIRRRVPHALLGINALVFALAVAGRCVGKQHPFAGVGMLALFSLVALGVPVAIALAQRRWIGPPARSLVVRDGAPRHQRESATTTIEVDGRAWPADAVRAVALTEELRYYKTGPAPSSYRVDVFITGRNIVRAFSGFDRAGAEALAQALSARLGAPLLPPRAAVRTIAPHMSLSNATFIGMTLMVAFFVVIGMISGGSGPPRDAGDFFSTLVGVALLQAATLGIPWLLYRGPARDLARAEIAARAPEGSASREAASPTSPSGVRIHAEGAPPEEVDVARASESANRARR